MVVFIVRCEGRGGGGAVELNLIATTFFGWIFRGLENRPSAPNGDVMRDPFHGSAPNGDVMRDPFHGSTQNGDVMQDPFYGSDRNVDVMRDLFYGAIASSKELAGREQFSQYPVHISAHNDLYDALESTLSNDANLEDLDLSRPADEVNFAFVDFIFKYYV